MSLLYLSFQKGGALAYFRLQLVLVFANLSFLEEMCLRYIIFGNLAANLETNSTLLFWWLRIKMVLAWLPVDLWAWLGVHSKELVLSYLIVVGHI